MDIFILGSSVLISANLNDLMSDNLLLLEKSTQNYFPGEFYKVFYF